jgi:hypothetical protein
MTWGERILFGLMALVAIGLIAIGIGAFIAERKAGR